MIPEASSLLLHWSERGPSSCGVNSEIMTRKESQVQVVLIVYHEVLLMREMIPFTKGLFFFKT